MTKKQIVNWILLSTWMVVIFMLSNEVADSSSERSGVIVEVISRSVSWSQDILTFLTRKAAHIFIYFVLGILMFNVARDFRISNKRAVMLSVVFVMLYAITDEFHQSFVPGRSAELRDVLIDTVAGAMGTLVYFCATAFRRSNASKM